MKRDTGSAAASASFGAALVVIALSAAGQPAEPAAQTPDYAIGYGPDPVLPAPNERLIPKVNIAPAVGWPKGATPVPASSLTVNAFAAGLDHPRWVYVLPNGDVLVAESNAPEGRDNLKGIKGWVTKRVMKNAGAGVPSADRITLLRDGDGDGVAEVREAFLENLHSPFGMALVGDQFYVANTDAVVRFPYHEGDLRISASPVTVVELPAGEINHHWTRNIIASPDGKRLYATVGSNSNLAENGLDNEIGRAAVWEVDLATGTHRIFASGLRNPNGLAWEPTTGKLWTSVNERDGLGNDLVPDYMTSLTDGGFYGWPYSYFGQNLDPNMKPRNPELVETALSPDYALGGHTSSMGLAWSGGNTLPRDFQQGMFVGQHGSWNRDPLSGYKVIFVPFTDGKPSGPPRDVLTGFVNDDGDAQGRPVGVAISRRGALLVADDVGNAVWRVNGAGTSAPGG